jgi:uncharacterized protein
MADRMAARRRRVQLLRAHFGWTGTATGGSRGALIALTGLPGTGKSFLAASIAARFPVAVIRSDEVRKVIFPSPAYSGTENATVYLTSYALLEALLADGYAVIFDATNLKRHGRRRLRQIASDAGALYLMLMTVSPNDVIVERLRRRTAGETPAFSSDADLDVYHRLADSMEGLAQSGEPAVIVDTSVSLQPAFDALEKLFARSSRADHDLTASGQNESK